MRSRQVQAQRGKRRDLFAAVKRVTFPLNSSVRRYRLVFVGSLFFRERSNGERDNDVERGGAPYASEVSSEGSDTGRLCIRRRRPAILYHYEPKLKFDVEAI
ncbi:hypothetical protein HNY73_006655 [Argiope bruennichi]|uniref:Uncharacterized protein n=1 Tax=Argiope bruennichi TaxID=94029 RepID=A0A8T0FBI1_ARGBR|nr:hypothetical protein HNY73_006655 [Argiope bruennichi]